MAEKNFGLTTVVDDVAGDDDRRGHHNGRGTALGKDDPGFERYINLAGILNFGFCLQAGWESIGYMMSIMLLNGGPASLVWGSLITGLGHIATATSLGEMASMDPTVGAQYRWSARFAPKNPEFWGLIQGWMTTFGWIVGCVPPLQYMSQVTTALIAFHNPTYVPTAWQTTMLMWAFLLVAIIVNLSLRRILNVLETLGGICHILFFVAIVVILCTLGQRSSVSFVFTEIINNVSGWTNPGVSFHLGMQVAFLPLAGYDSVIHMVDETKQPQKRVPLAMIFSTTSNAILAFAYSLCLMFFIGDIERVSTATMPLLEVYYQATNSKAATTIMLLMHAFTLMVCGFNIIASASRLTWAFARDKGLPCHKFFSRVHPTLQVPLQALGLVCGVTIVLSCINLGSAVGLAAVVSLNSFAILASYFLPIFLLVLRKLSGQHPRYGPFHLGRWGLPINLFAMVFLLWGIFWVSFPIAYPVTSEYMNYAAPIFIGVVSLALLDWFTTGKKRFEVPTGEYNIEVEMTDRKGSGDASTN